MRNHLFIDPSKVFRKPIVDFFIHSLPPLELKIYFEALSEYTHRDKQTNVIDTIHAPPPSTISPIPKICTELSGIFMKPGGYIFVPSYIGPPCILIWSYESKLILMNNFIKSTSKNSSFFWFYTVKYFCLTVTEQILMCIHGF